MTFTDSDSGISVTSYHRPVDGDYTWLARHGDRTALFVTEWDMPGWKLFAHARRALRLPPGPNDDIILGL